MTQGTKFYREHLAIPPMHDKNAVIRGAKMLKRLLPKDFTIKNITEDGFTITWQNSKKQTEHAFVTYGDFEDRYKCNADFTGTEYHNQPEIASPKDALRFMQLTAAINKLPLGQID